MKRRRMLVRDEHGVVHDDLWVDRVAVFAHQTKRWPLSFLCDALALVDAVDVDGPVTCVLCLAKEGRDDVE